LKKIIFPFIFWGEDYANNLSEYCLKTLINEISFLDKKKFRIDIALWSSKNDFNIVKKNFKHLSKKFNFINIELFLNENSLKKLNKYQFLNVIQLLILTKYKKEYDYMFFLYPDFVLSKNSIVNIFKKIKKFDLMFVYAPQIIKEEYIKEHQDVKIKYTTQKFVYENLHRIVTSNTVNKDNSFNTGACINFKFKDYFILRNFHLHPICISLKSFSKDLLKPFNISLDEDFVGNLNLNSKKIYIPNSSNDMIFASLCGLNEIKIPKIRNNSFYKIQNWIQLHAYNNHTYLSKNNFFLENTEHGKKNKNIKDIDYVENFMLKIYEKINLKSTDLFNKDDYIYLIERKAHLEKNQNKIKNSIIDYHQNKIFNTTFKENKINKRIKYFLKNNIY